MRTPLLRLAAIIAVAVSPAAAQAAQSGIVVTDLAQAATAAKTGAKYVRFYFNWDGSSSTPRIVDLADTDRAMATVLAAGMKPILVVTGKGTPPTMSTVGAFASYMGAIAQHYAGRVVAYEAWNEPDEAVFWGTPGGDPAVYAALLKATYPKVKPYAPLFIGGLTGNNYRFVEKVYDQLGGSSAGAFDGIAVHTDFICVTRPPDQFYRDPDNRISQYGFLGFRELRQTMVDHGDADKPIWMTEIGWPTSKAVCDGGAQAGKKPGGVSEALQAAYLSLAYHCLREYPYVQVALWYDTQDVGPEVSLHRFGLIRTDGTHKPAYAAFEKVVAGEDVDAGKPCGDFTGPTLDVTTPTANAIFTDLLALDASASDPSGMQQLLFLADGKKIFGIGGYREDGKYPPTLRAGTDWRDARGLFGLGNHTITVVAYDAYGNPTTAVIPVTKADPSKIKQLPTTFKTFKVTGKGSRRAIVARVIAPGSAIPFRYFHKVRIYVQKKSGRRWRQVYAVGRGAKNTLVGRVRLTRGRYRAFAVFPRKAPFLGTRTPYRYFSVR